MNNSYLNKNKMKMSYKQLSFILTILLLLFTLSFACSPAVNPRDNNDEKTVFTPSLHIKVSDGSTDITDSLSIGVNNSNLITITGLSNTVAADKTYTLTITPLADIFSIDGNDISIEITDSDGFSPGDGVLSSRSFTITNVNDESNPISYTLEVPFSGAPVEDWLTIDPLSTYIKATFASQAASLTLSGNTLSVNGLFNADSGTGSISFTLPTGFVANPDSITLPDPDGSDIGAATIIPSPATFTISESDNTKNSQTYTVDTISLAALTAFTPSRHITITDDSIADPALNDITDTLMIRTDDMKNITISGLSNAVGENKTYTLTITPVADIFSTSSGTDITITITEPLGFSPGDGALSPSDSFTITNVSDPSNSISYTVVVPIVGAVINEWLTETTFTTYFTGATFEGQTLDSGALSFNFDGDSIAIDGSSIFNLQDGSLLLTTNIADGYTLTQNLIDPDEDEVAALTDADAGSITITEEGNTANTKTYTVTISLAAYVSPVETSHVTAMFNGITARSSDIEKSGANIIISGFPNITGSTGSVSITPTAGYTIDPDPLSLSFTDPDGTDSQDIEAGTVSVTSAGVTALHTIIIRFSAPISLKIISNNVPSGTVTILKGDTVTLTGLDACELLPQPTFEVVGSTSATVRGFPSYFDRRIDSDSGTGIYPYTVNRVLKLVDASGDVLDETFTVNITGFPACDDDTIFTNTHTGNDADPYEIDSAPKLELLSHLVRTDNDNHASKFYKLTADIDLGSAGLPWSQTASGETGEGFPPIGLTDFTFQGTFDCADLSISNLYINKANDNIGLFGITSNNAAIQNCSLINVNVTGGEQVGGLAGNLGSNSSITNSYATGTVTGTGNYVGGLVGYSFSASVTDSYATGDVEGTNNVGGLAGWLFSSSITDSYATGSVTGTGSAVGGLAGYLQTSSSITNSYATGTVTGTGSAFGGLVGWVSSSSITNSYATGDVEGTYRVGGLAGYLKGSENSPSISNSYATGDVEGTNNVGLFIGFNVNTSPPITIVYTGVTDSYYNNEAVLTVGDTVLAAKKGVGSDGDTDDTTTMNLTGLDKSALQVAKGTTSGEPYSTWPEASWLFMAGQYPRLITVTCPNRQYPTDPNNVPTACTNL